MWITPAKNCKLIVAVDWNQLRLEITLKTRFHIQLMRYFSINGKETPRGQDKSVPGHLPVDSFEIEPDAGKHFISVLCNISKWSCAFQPVCR